MPFHGRKRQTAKRREKSLKTAKNTAHKNKSDLKKIAIKPKRNKKNNDYIKIVTKTVHMFKTTNENL